MAHIQDVTGLSDSDEESDEYEEVGFREWSRDELKRWWRSIRTARRSAGKAFWYVGSSLAIVGLPLLMAYTLDSKSELPTTQRQLKLDRAIHQYEVMVMDANSPINRASLSVQPL